jgi:uncharacterized protein DUF4255/carboxypeptidase family protein
VLSFAQAMLTELHQVLTELIYDKGRIDRADVDVDFEVPTRDWIDGLVRPTLCLYLFQLQENMDLRHAQFQTRRVNGHAEFHSPPRRVDLHYLVTAVTTSTDDGYRLLWRTLGVLMRAPELGAELFADDVRIDAPIVTRIAEPDNAVKLLDVWSAVGTEPRPAFSYVVTLPVDLAMAFEAPLVLTRTVGYRRLAQDERHEARTYITGTVRDAAGLSLADVTVALAAEPAAWTRTDPRGSFSLQTPERGQVDLRLSRPGGTPRTVTIEVPSPTYDLRFD